MKVADHIIDLGPGAGKEGGIIVLEGAPEEIIKCKTSLTAKYLASSISSSKN